MSKQTLYVAAVVSLGLFQVHVVNAFDALTDPGLVAWWGFDEGTGTLAVDESVHGNDGAINGDAAWAAGMHGEALVFDGGDVYVSTEQNLINDLTGFTLAGWVNAGITGSYASLFGQNDLVEFGLTSENGGGIGTWMSGNSWAYVGAEYPFSYPSWHHVALTGDATRVVIYIDGQEEASDEGGMVSGTSGYTFSIGANVFNASGDPFQGEMDDVCVYGRALTQEEILQVMRGAGVSGKAVSPSPADEEDDVALDVDLTWTPGPYPGSHDVYLGTDYDDVNDASRDRPGDVLVSIGQTDPNYTPMGLVLDQTYYWRVDEVNATPDATVFKGPVWSFQAEATAFPVIPIAATASSVFSASSGPEKTIDRSGLDADGRHSTVNSDMWMSAENDPNGTWIQYEFDKVYKLHQMMVWNSNQSLESVVGVGVKTATLETSLDGETWTPLGEEVEFARAPGMEGYASNTTIELAGALARFLRVNCLSNWGDGAFLKGKSLSEVRFSRIPTAARRPKPEPGSTLESLDEQLVWRAGRGAEQHQLYLDADEALVAAGDSSVLMATLAERKYDLGQADLVFDETYFWKIVEVAGDEVTDGPVWNFTTQEYLTVDDMESYDDEDNLIYLTWIDGYGDETNGSTVGHLVSPFAEQDIAISGQSMPFYYENGAGVTATAERALHGQDWTTGGVKTLTVYFMGDRGNVGGQLFVEVNGKRVSSPASLSTGLWKQLNVDLASLGTNLASVQTLTIGVAGTGEGVVYIDEIRLYREAPALAPPSDPGIETLVAHWTLDEGAGTTVADSAGSHNGTTQGNPLWVDGILGGALELDGTDAYVDFGAGPAFDIKDVITLSVWVNPADAGNGEHNPYLSKGDTAYAIKHASGNGMEFFIHENGSWYTTFASVDDSFNGNWHHVAGTFDGSQAKLYVDGLLRSTRDHEGGIGVNAFEVNIGRNSEQTDRFYEGAIDDVRIYHSVLSEGEVRYLAGDR